VKWRGEPARIRGSIVPVVTPFATDGTQDLHGLRRLIRWQMESGSHGISLGGSTGEPGAQSTQERAAAIRTAAVAIRDRVPFVPGTGSAQLPETLELTAIAKDAGADAVLVITPYYARPTQEGLFAWYSAVAREFPDLPIIVYNVPSRTAVDIAPETVARLRRAHHNIVGVKETTKDFEHFSRVMHLAGTDTLVWSGIELLCLPLLALGGTGFVSATANLAPAAVAKMYEHWEAGDLDKARTIHFGLHPVTDVIFTETNPAAAKWVLAQAGLIKSGYVRPPLVPLTEAGQRTVRDLLKKGAPVLEGPVAAVLVLRTATTGGPVIPEQISHFIGGRHVPAADGATFEVTDPVSNQVYARVAAGREQDVDRAVTTARIAFECGPWPHLAARARAKILNRVADGIEARGAEIAELETFDTGLPITQARGQAARAAENFRFFADMIVAQHEAAFSQPGQLGYVLRKPTGVAGLITPWNTPFMLASWKLAPALASGCTVVLKPAEWTPASASVLPEIMTEAGVTDGVVNIVHGIGEEAGAALVAHPQVPLISFTGQTATGRVIMRSAAAHLKGLSMELGGKSPCVIFADADLDLATDSALFGVMSLNGERCTAGSRILAERSVYGELVERLAARAARVVVGPPSDPRTEIGALVHPEHYQRVLDYVEIGMKEGARLVAGGSRPAGLQPGNYLAATVFADVTPRMRIFQEEIFGPVVCVTPFDSEQEAIALANETRYGLAAYIWTSDLRRAHRVAAAVEAGMTWVNSHNVRDLRTPFGGVKASGLGREGGQHSIDFYTESRIVHVALGETHVPRFGA
jgi:5-carboxymethyl-2-hydroxymuconic-semialdehyde dehydrogenase